MPHLYVEYSANIESEIDPPRLFDALFDAAVATGVFEPGGIRVRGLRIDRYRVADGHPDNGFVHLIAKIGHGRDEATKKRMGEALFAALTAYLQPLYDRRPLGISFEVHELHPVLNFKKNNLHDHVKRRAAARAAE
ncbi:MAG: 5-carboxymethyl-2-hydroxymuconate Delta-isomerase [Alphaproteobacteria bacterium]|nr:5-carboxymethyl-2-hydroxymuconate Delta-isomerase [Alphaproteobacteria bacterium]